MPKRKGEVPSKRVGDKSSGLEPSTVRKLTVIVNGKDTSQARPERITLAAESEEASKRSRAREIGNLPRVIQFAKGKSLKKEAPEEFNDPEARENAKGRFSSADDPQSVEEWLGHMETTMNRVIRSIAEELCSDFSSEL